MPGVDFGFQGAFGSVFVPKAIGEFRKFTDQPLTLRGGDYAHAVQELKTAVDRANKLLQ